MAAGHKRVLLQSPTGSGKTRTSARIIDSAVAKGKRALFLVGGRVLVKQAHRSFLDLGIDAAILMAGMPYQRSAPVQVASVHTVFARLEYLDWLEPDLIVTDECHEADTKMWAAIRERWPAAFEVGLSATPKPGTVYSAMAKGPGYRWLIDEGYLVKPRYFSVKESDSELLKLSGGEFTEKSQEAAFERITLVGGVVEHYRRFARGRPTVLFGPSVAVSRKNADDFNAAGIAAFHMDADTPQEERDAAFAAITAGELHVICNYNVLSRGFDSPAISCVIVERETKSLATWIQMVGRGLRAYPAKSDCIVLDLGENIYRFGCFVEDPVEWTLEGKARPEEERQREREQRPVKDVTCTACHFVYRAAAACPNCGHKPERPYREAKAEERRDTELSEVRPKSRRKEYSPADKRRWHAMLRYWQQYKGKQPLWADFTFEQKFGHLPKPEHVGGAPVYPDKEVAGYIRSRMIAWAKRRQSQSQYAGHD